MLVGVRSGVRKTKATHSAGARVGRHDMLYIGGDVHDGSRYVRGASDAVVVMLSTRSVTQLF